MGDAALFCNAEEDRPLPSPHPVFGKKPGLWTRLFGDERDNFWPTEGDVKLFTDHMRGCLHNGEIICYDRVEWLGPVDPSWARRQEVLAVKRLHEAQQTDQREWWERL